MRTAVQSFSDFPRIVETATVAVLPAIRISRHRLKSKIADSQHCPAASIPAAQVIPVMETRSSCRVCDGNANRSNGDPTEPD